MIILNGISAPFRWVANQICPNFVKSAVQAIHESGRALFVEARSGELGNRFRNHNALNTWLSEPVLGEQREEAVRRIERAIQDPNARDLQLNNLNLSSLPDCFGKLAHLTTLNLSNNRLTILPNSFNALIHLHALNLSQNQLCAIFLNCPHLNALDLSNNPFLSHQMVLNCPHIIQMNVDEPARLPNGIQNASHRLGLPVLSNALQRWVEAGLPGEGRATAKARILASLANPAGAPLDLSDLHLTELPQCLRNLDGLLELNLEGNQLAALPEELGMVRSLERLNLNRNQFAQFPDVVSRIGSLRELHLKDNQLNDIPDMIRNLRQLRKLDLRGNRLETLTPTLKTLHSAILLKNNSFSLSVASFFYSMFKCFSSPPLHPPPAIPPLPLEPVNVPPAPPPSLPANMPPPILRTNNALPVSNAYRNFLQAFLAGAGAGYPGANPLNYRAHFAQFINILSNQPGYQYLQNITNIEKEYLIDFICRVGGTIDFEDVNLRPNLIVRVDRMLRAANDSAPFRGRMLVHMENALNHCTDRIALGLDDMYMDWHLLCNPQTRNPKDLIHFLLAWTRYYQLQDIAKAKCLEYDAANVVYDDVEVYLKYLVNSRVALSLPLATHRMRHNAPVTPLEIAQAQHQILHGTNAADRETMIALVARSPGWREQRFAIDRPEENRKLQGKLDQIATKYAIHLDIAGKRANLNAGESVDLNQVFDDFEDEILEHFPGVNGATATPAAKRHMARACLLSLGIPNLGPITQNDFIVLSTTTLPRLREQEQNAQLVQSMRDYTAPFVDSYIAQPSVAVFD